jgi:hypothetical protein
VTSANPPRSRLSAAMVPIPPVPTKSTRAFRGIVSAVLMSSCRGFEAITNTKYVWSILGCTALTFPPQDNSALPACESEVGPRRWVCYQIKLRYRKAISTLSLSSIFHTFHLIPLVFQMVLGLPRDLTSYRGCADPSCSSLPEELQCRGCQRS